MKAYPVVLLVLITFFVISFVTNLLGPIFPALIDSYQIGLLLAGFFPFAFFAAYGLMSIPAGLLAQEKGEKFVIVFAFALATLGAILFVVLPTFAMAMFALFTIGSAMALLQVAINPLLRRAGGEQHFAAFSVAAQLLFGAAATLSPIVYSSLVSHIQTGSELGQQLSTFTQPNKDWLIMYALFAVISIIMLIITLFTVIPKAQQGSTTIRFSESLALFKDKTVLLFFIAIACYVGLEQGIANSISVFLATYHDVDPNTQGTEVVSQFWLLLTIGCILGLALLKIMDAKQVLKLFSIGAACSLMFAIFGTKEIALIAFPASGFFLSIMWSVIFSLGLNSVAKGHSAVSGILCTGIVGGALASPIIGFFAELSGDLRFSLLVLLIPLGFIFSVSVWAKPLIKNHTIQLVKKRTAMD
ncbi:MFS transporter [Pseudoalteromonas piratica]|uniref:Major facilitator transporter n=1 Tax=Pseudoalteromonas piratica TaxID=1348114 RepID=A0A0A7EN71_9GAMM|nr:MFS transporter [Pseudoalteromonas piratica]AIY67437.1 major facilitator transporter [Pseudoalteromonas piratica]